MSAADQARQSDAKISTASLSGAARTCLITLALRAADAASPAPVLADRRAAQLLSRTDADPEELRLPAASAAAALLRAREIDRITEEFLAGGGRRAVVSVGSGLDSRLQRLGGIPETWIDLDLPEVADLRCRLIPDQGPARTIAGSFLEAGWLEEAAPLVAGASILLIADGVLNYLPAEPLAKAFQLTAQRIGGFELVADVMSGFFAAAAQFIGAVRRARAWILWGTSSPARLERMFPFRVTSLRAYLRPDEPALGPGRGMYRLPLLRNMSRILRAEAVGPAL